MRYLDLTHSFKKNMPAYPGDPLSEIIQTAFFAKDGYNAFQIKTGLHVGTHLDAPLHMLENGKKISDYPPSYFFGPGHLIEIKDGKFDAGLLENRNISKGDIVFLLTGFSKKFGTAEYYESYPEMSEAFAKKIIELGVKIVGLDAPSPDRAPFAIHKMLLKNDVLLIENLANLELLSGLERFEVIALPIKLEAEAAPVRVVAVVQEETMAEK